MNGRQHGKTAATIEGHGCVYARKRKSGLPGFLTRRGVTHRIRHGEPRVIDSLEIRPWDCSCGRTTGVDVGRADL